MDEEKSKEMTGFSNMRTTDVLLVSGKRGTGKTFFVKWYIKEHLLGRVSVFIYDPLWQYGDLGEVVHDLNEANSKQGVMKSNKALVYQPSPEDDNLDVFDDVAGWVLQRKNIVLVGEEINEYMTPNMITPQFRALVRRGRNYGIGIFAVTHRPAYLSLNFLNMIDHWFIFQQDLKRDLERLYEYMERANPEIDEDFIAGLPDRHFIHYFRDRDTGKAKAVPMKPVKPKEKIETQTVGK